MFAKEKAKESLNSIRRSGWFHDYLIDYALEELENGEE